MPDLMAIMTLDGAELLSPLIFLPGDLLPGLIVRIVLASITIRSRSFRPFERSGSMLDLMSAEHRWSTVSWIMGGAMLSCSKEILCPLLLSSWSPCRLLCLMKPTDLERAGVGVVVCRASL